MKTTLVGVAFLFVSAVAFAVGDITAAKSAENDISSALGRDAATGQPYLRVFVVNRGDVSLAPAAVSSATTSLSRAVTLTEGSSVSITGTLTSAAAAGRPCDLIVFQNGQSQLFLVEPSGTSLKNMSVTGTVSASGNPLGYSCSLILKYIAP
jgi:hypothetical protein